MDWWVVKQLRAKLLEDLRDIVPLGYFESKVENLKLYEEIKNSNHFNRELKWGYLAAILGKQLFIDPTPNMTARQVSASEVLMQLGLLASAEAAHGALMQLAKDADSKVVSDGNAGAVAKQLEGEHILTFSDNVRGALEQYLLHLTPSESAPFLPLLGSTSTPQAQGTSPMTITINNFGTVGSFQTGTNAVANVVQNLGINERSSITAALQQFKEAIDVDSSLTDSQKLELLKSVQECKTEIDNNSPDNSKLLTMFNILGTTIQSISSAPPAYQVLKMAVLPFGIPLP